MNKILIITILVLVSSNSDIDTLTFKEFTKFITKYNKKYTSLNEYMARFEVFKRNLMAIFEEAPQLPYEIGINQFTDLTDQEFAKTYLTLSYDAFDYINPYPVSLNENFEAAPTSWDWRSKGYCTPVKNQGSCGSCYAFAATANLEGLYYKGKKTLKSLSEQMIVDCDGINRGCTDGKPDNAFMWLFTAGGIMTDSDYPYTGVKGKCNMNAGKFINMRIDGFQRLDSTDENTIKEFLYQIGPVTAALNSRSLKPYKSGVFDKTTAQCSPEGTNHAVALVGYGHDNSSNKDYWIVRNSWGKTWGESGYFRIKRGSGTCGINKYIVTAKVSF